MILCPYSFERYIDLHWELFGDYKGELMLQPSRYVFNRCQGNFYDFLVANNMSVLADRIDLSIKVPGYG